MRPPSPTSRPVARFPLVSQQAQAFYVAEDLENAIEYYEKSGELDLEVGSISLLHCQIEDDLSAAQKFEKCALVALPPFIECSFPFSVMMPPARRTRATSTTAAASTTSWETAWTRRPSVS